MNSFISHFLKNLLSLLLGRQLKTFYVTEALVLSWYVCVRDKRKRRPSRLLSSFCLSGKSWLNNASTAFKHDFFISYRTQEAKDAVSSFRVAGLSDTVRLGSRAEHRRGQEPWLRLPARLTVRQLQPEPCHCHRQTIWCTSAEINTLQHFFPRLISCV